jgi:hypothetical protein
MTVSALLNRVRYALPEGRPLPENVWQRRHSGILALLWLHATGIVGFALLRGYSLPHSLFEGSLVAAAALLAGSRRRTRKFRASMASLGLITSSAVLVHLSGGYIEFHFHFFVMIAVMALYQDWTPFLLAIVYVVLEHGRCGYEAKLFGFLEVRDGSLRRFDVLARGKAWGKHSGVPYAPFGKFVLSVGFAVARPGATFDAPPVKNYIEDYVRTTDLRVSELRGK